MRTLLLVFASVIVIEAGCNSLLGNDAHRLAPPTGGTHGGAGGFVLGGSGGTGGVDGGSGGIDGGSADGPIDTQRNSDVAMDLLSHDTIDVPTEIDSPLGGEDVSPGRDGTGGSIGADGTGGAGGAGGFDGSSSEAPVPDVSASGGAPGSGGAIGTGGTTGIDGGGGLDGGGGCIPACTEDQDCIGGSCVASRWGGKTCNATTDCPSWATCCDGSIESCDGTRLPRGDGTNSGEFAVSGDGLTVTDTITYLVWQRDGSGTRAGCSGSGNLTCAWNEAKAYCAGLTLGGVSGWRLPAWMELLTIVDMTTSNPSIDATAFPNTPAEDFWTSSPLVGYPGVAWYVSFKYGFYDNGGTGYRVRCVR